MITTYVPVPLGERLDDLKEDMNGHKKDVNLPDYLKEDVRSFFLVSHAVLEERTTKLICSEIINDSVMNSDVRDFFEGDAPISFGQSHREDLLYRADVISGSLYSKLQKVRGVRNKVAHEYNFHIHSSWEDDLENKAEMAVEAYKEILSLCPDVDSSTLDVV